MGKGAKERVVPFSYTLRPVLYRWLVKAPRSPYVFATRNGSRVSYRNAYRELQHWWAAAGVTTPCHPHLLRHQFASHFIQHGGDVYRLCRILGHRSISTTQMYLRALGVEELRTGREHLTPLGGR